MSSNRFIPMVMTELKMDFQEVQMRGLADKTNK